MGDYRVGIVGAGVIAQEHLRALQGLKFMRVVGVCDSDEQKALKTASEWKIQSHYVDFHKMLEEKALEIVSILTPPQSHAALVTRAADKGVNVLVEKPLTIATSDAKLVVDELRRSKVKLTVVYHYLLSRVMRKAVSLLSAGTIGEVLSVSVALLGGPKDDVMGSNPNHWSHTIPGGRFAEMLPHPIYLLQAFLGDDLQVDNVVTAKRGQRSWMPRDELDLTLHAKAGIGHIYVSFNSPRPAEYVEIYGTKRILRIDLSNQTLLSLGPRNFTKVGSVQDTLRVATQLVSQTVGNTLHFAGRVRGESALQFAYQSFVDYIEGRRRAPVPIEMAYKTVEICERVTRRF